MKKKLNIIVNYYTMFCIYALIGWLYEVLWMRFIVEPHEWINRGVLIGPFLPIYGFGMILLYVLLKKIIKKVHPISNKIYRYISIITIVTFVYTTIIEYTTPKIYHVFDYLKQYGIGLVITNIVGIIIINIILNKTKNKKIKKLDVTVILIFISIWIIATLVEYLSHFIMDKCFNVLLWNYAKDFLNINRRINWDASRNFAIGGTFLLYTIQPFITNYVFKISKKINYTIAILMGSLMTIDFIFHVILKMI